MSEITRKYDCLFVDVVNFCYRTFRRAEESPIQVGSKLVYKDSICNFIKAIEELSEKFLHSEGEVYLLFDNYFSRADLKSSFMFADRKKLDEAYKKTRKKENREFYNSVNFLKYYFLLGSKKYHTLQITGLEADDLVKPLLEKRCAEKSCLLVTTDLDWCRYLSKDPRIDWLPDLSTIPETIEDLSLKLGFKVTENNIILYKAIFGDDSDDIQGIISENSRRREEFISLLREITYPEQLILLSKDKTQAEYNEILEAISKDESRLTINIQLVSSIPCSPSYLDEALTTGREATTSQKVIAEAIGLVEDSKEFIFGKRRVKG